MAPLVVYKAYDAIFGEMNTKLFNTLAKILQPTIIFVVNNILGKGINPNSLIKTFLKTDAL